MNEVFVITVSGSRAGAGKTRLIERLLPCMGRCAAVKARVQEHEGLSVVVEDNPRRSPQKDTGRYLAAGAVRAFLITGGRAEVLREVEKIVAGGEFEVVVVESNTVAREIESDLSFFIKSEGKAKPGADICEKLADVIVCGISQKQGRSDAGRRKSGNRGRAQEGS